MAKNYQSLFDGGNDSIALEQKMFVKEETTRGVLEAPLDADFIYHTGGSVNFTQPIESSPHKSGRHHTDIIEQRTETAWTMNTFYNIDTTLGAAAVTEIDPAFRVLHESAMGNEDVTGGSPVYDTSTAPDITFSIFENGDVWAKQASGCFVESMTMNFPGDGQATAEMAGMGKTSITVGISELVSADYTGNTVDVQVGHGDRFPVGSVVMLVEADGVTRSADTPNGSPRVVTDVTGDTVTVDGAVLADADASGARIFLVYYEPESPTAINDVQTGLVGSITVANLPALDCVRNLTVALTNNHELQDFCYGESGLGGKLFVPGGRATFEVTMELNMNAKLVEFLNNKATFTGDDIDLVLGDVAGRHLAIDMPKVIFPIPPVDVPETGTIPVTFTGNAYQTALDAADEITLSYL
jgi:hypothetical protein